MIVLAIKIVGFDPVLWHVLVDARHRALTPLAQRFLLDALVVY